MDNRTFDKKFDCLRMSLERRKKVLIAFSGGVDSTFLLHAASQALPKENTLAVTFSTPYMLRDQANAGQTVEKWGLPHETLEQGFPEELRNNGQDRCYRCKHLLFTRLRELADERGIEHILDGTNADDIKEYRPGLRALEELGIESPLMDAGLTKADIRTLSRQQGLPTWNMPSTPCLLTRLPHDQPVTEAMLRSIEQAENLLRDEGFSALRVRGHGPMARIELPQDQIPTLVQPALRFRIDNAVKKLGFDYVTLDLAGYRMGGFDDTNKGGE